MTAEALATFRFLLIYPIMLVFGTAWSILMYRRWKQLRCIGDGLAFALGVSIAAWGGLGLGALYVAQIVMAGTYTMLTGAMFTIGSIIVCSVLVVGVIWLFSVSWRNGKMR